MPILEALNRFSDYSDGLETLFPAGPSHLEPAPESDLDFNDESR